MINLAVVGTGGMAREQMKYFSAMRGVKVVACCDVLRERAEKFAKDFGIRHCFTDYNEMFDSALKITAITNVTIDKMHAPVALAAISRGLHILSEKPLATDLAEARTMRDAAEDRSVINMVNFSYRNAPALQKAAAMLKSGKLGRIMHVEASYLQGWLVGKYWGDWRTDDKFTWRLSSAHGSGGVLGDVGCHILDMVTFQCGDIDTVQAMLRTFNKADGGRIGEYILDANDSFVANVSFVKGGLGVVHASRWATGQANSLRTRVYCEDGAVEVDLDVSRVSYRMISGRKNIDSNKWREVKCINTPNNYERFIKSIRTGINDESDFRNGTKIQAYLDNIMLAAKEGSSRQVVF